MPPNPGGNMVRETLHEYRAQLEKLRQQSENNFDRAMLTLSGGALALSLTFIGLSPTGFNSAWLVITAWALFTGALLCTLLSFRTSALAMTHAIKSIDKAQVSGEPNLTSNPFNRWTARFNHAAAVVFILGTIAFVVFAGLNVDVLERPRPEAIVSEDKKKKPQEAVETRTMNFGLSVPPVPSALLSTSPTEGDASPQSAEGAHTASSQSGSVSDPNAPSERSNNEDN